MKDVEPGINPEQRIGHAEGPAVAKSQVGIPLAVETNRKEQGDAGTDHTNGKLQKPGRKIDAGLRKRIGFGQRGGPPGPTVSG
jgi:hypothetical protein